MKAIMRLDKSQVSAVARFEGSGVFRSDLRIMAGYKTYDAILVGAAGGKGGFAISKGSPVRYKMYPCGGGGGGSLVLRGNLADIPSVTTVQVGRVGADGLDGGPDAKAGDGTPGENTVWNGRTAFGGGGGIGGDFTSTVYTKPTVNVDKVDVTTRPLGGNGGGNSAGLGTGGIGGKMYMNEIPSNGVPVETAGVPATAGTYIVGSPTPDVIGGGVGGGGGFGSNRSPEYPDKNAEPGKDGGVSYLDAPGLPNTTYDGGTGGGANVMPITGVSETYGGGDSLYGIVVMKFS